MESGVKYPSVVGFLLICKDMTLSIDLVGKLICFIISFCQGCKFMSEGYLWILRKTNSNDSTVCMANFKILPATVKK